MSKTLSANSGPASVVKVLIAVAAIVLLSGGALVFLMNSQISDMSKTLAGKESEVDGKQQIANKYNTTLALYNATSARTQFLEASVTPKSFVPTLLSQLQVLAEQTKLQVLDIHPGGISAGPAAPAADGQAPPKQPYDTMDIGLDVTGSYSETMTFLYDLTTFPKIVSVSSVQFHPSGSITNSDGQTVPLISTSMHFTAFLFHDSGAVVSSLTPAPAPVVNTMARPVLARSAVIGRTASHAVSTTIGVAESNRGRGDVAVGTL